MISTSLFPELPVPFSVGIVDPPWDIQLRSAKGHKKSPQNHYSCMPLEQIAALPVGDLFAKDSIMLLWATNPLLPAGIEVLKRWGFEYSTVMTWVKTTQTGKLCWGTGYQLRGCTEHLLVGKRGSPGRPRVMPRSALLSPRREHSRKPSEIYEYAESFELPPHYLEIFARPWEENKDRANWVFVGNEMTGRDVREDLERLRKGVAL